MMGDCLSGTGLGGAEALEPDSGLHPSDAIPIAIELPWPPKELTPNAKRRKHWRVYQPIAKQYRLECMLLTISQRKRTAGGGKITAITFYPPDRRKRDDDGMIGAFKAGRDGVADALGCDDHTFRPAYLFAAEPVKGGRVIVVIGEDK